MKKDNLQTALEVLPVVFLISYMVTLTILNNWK